MASIQILQDRFDRVAAGHNLVTARREPAQRSRNSNPDWHGDGLNLLNSTQNAAGTHAAPASGFAVPLCSAWITGAEPAACALCTLHSPSRTRPTSLSSLKALATFGRIVPPAVGITILSGNFQPSCSATS